jgi:hypothetical protein
MDLTASTETRIDADITVINETRIWTDLTASTERGWTRIQHRIERTRITRMFLTLMLARETVAEAAGFEPAFAAPKAAVLPLNDAPSGEDSAVSV